MQGKVRRGGEKTETTCKQSYSRTRTRTHAHAHAHTHTHTRTCTPVSSFTSCCFLCLPMLTPHPHPRFHRLVGYLQHRAGQRLNVPMLSHPFHQLRTIPHHPAVPRRSVLNNIYPALSLATFTHLHALTHTHSHSRAHSHTCDRVPPLLFFSDVSDSQTQSSDASASASGVRVVGGGAGDGGGSDDNTTAASRADGAQQRRQQEQVQEIVRELAQMRVSRQLLDAWKQADTKVQRLHQHPHRPLTHALFVSGALLSLLLCFC